MMYRIDSDPERRGDTITLQGSITEEQALTLFEAVKGIWPKAIIRKPLPMQWVDVNKQPKTPVYDEEGRILSA